MNNNFEYNFKLSVIVPVYNEESTILTLLDKIINIKDLDKEIIVVDDGSTDKTSELISQYNKKNNIRLISHNKNKGKGAAIKTAKQYITGNIIIIQDADLEYDPKEYKNLIYPIINDQFKVVYGSRVLGKSRYSKNFTSIFRIFANHILTIISNIINKQNLTDAHTCYKVFHRDIFNNINLEEDGFSFCPEITTKVSLMKENICEIPISYYGRTYKEGKKIGFMDGIRALKVLIKYRYLK